MSAWTDADFDELSWHDNQLYALALRTGDPAAGDWTGDLVLDIDHIVEWVRGEEGMAFRVAPATLTFHGVTDLRIDADWSDSGFQVAPPPACIDVIERQRVADQKIFLDRPYWLWRLVLSSPRGGQIGLGAVGFTQELRAEPVLCREQWLPGRKPWR